MKKRYVIAILDSLAIVTFISTFTPLVIPQNEVEPAIAGMPYTMWMGLLVSIVFIVFAYLVSINQEKINDH